MAIPVISRERLVIDWVAMPKVKRTRSVRSMSKLELFCSISSYGREVVAGDFYQMRPLAKPTAIRSSMAATVHRTTRMVTRWSNRFPAHAPAKADRVAAVKSIALAPTSAAENLVAYAEERREDRWNAKAEHHGAVGVFAE